MKKQNLTDEVRVIPVVVIRDIAETVPTLEALRDGGIPAAEITFRTPCAAEAIRIGRERFPEMHIGAGTVLAGVVEPASATPVVVEDNVMIGANAVVIEGVRIGRNAVVGAGAIVISDVPPNAVVVGNPARVIKMKDDKTEAKTALVDALRKL